MGTPSTTLAFKTTAHPPRTDKNKLTIIMFRTSLVKAARPSQRLFSTSVRAMSAGDTGSGASRAGGIRSGDAFTKREAAQEEMYIRNEERQKLINIRERLIQQQQHIQELTKHIDDITAGEGGQGEQPGSDGGKK